MPVVRDAVRRAVLAHRRDHDAVLQAQPREIERREHGRHDELAGQALLVHEEAIHLLDVVRVAHPEVLVGDATRATEQAERQALRVMRQVPAGLREPILALLCRALRSRD